MFDSPIVDVAMGLFTVYFILSSVSSALNEAVSAILSKRAKDLRRTIEHMLGSDAAAAEPAAAAPAAPGVVPATAQGAAINLLGAGLARRLYAHGLIGGLATRPDHQPSYIPSHTFAVVLLDLIAPADGQAPRTFEQVRQAIAQIPNQRLRDTLLPLVDAANNDLGRARINIARWFDDAMDRASGLYKRWAQRIVMIIALVMVAALNADTLMMAQALWNEPALRSATIKFADVQIASGGADTSAMPAPAAKPTPSATPGPSDARAESLPQLANEIQQLRMPLGWCIDWPNAKPLCIKPNTFAIDSPWAWLIKILGLLLTALLVSLGAPFWFDLLSRAANLRQTGDEPARVPNRLVQADPAPH